MRRALCRVTFLGMLGTACGCAGSGERDGGGDAAAETAAMLPGEEEVRRGEVFDEAAEEGRKTRVEAALGDIAYVDREAGFVLVRGSASARISPGEILEARTPSGGEAGVLVLSPERKRQFLVADITSGAPAVGNAVYYQVEIPVPKPQSASQQHDSGKEARERILEKVVFGGAEARPLEEALGRFLARDYRAVIASPPFDNSAMDGYALRAADAAEAGAELRVTGEQPAAVDRGLSLGEGEAIRIFTGAPIPSGASAVVMQEDVETGGDRIRLKEGVAEGEFIRRAGADLCVGQAIAEQGDPVTPRVIALLASQGFAAAEVGKAPVASVITTGDEVVPAGEGSLEPGQIFNSNGPMLGALLRRSGVEEVFREHATDEETVLEEAIGRALDRSDVVVLAGGVSVGERDLVKSVLERRGVTTGFWRVRVKPGKPFLFGHRGETLVFGLPGNPVSGLVTYSLFVEPAIRRWMGARDGVPEAIPCEMGEPVDNPGDRPHYIRGSLDLETLRFRPLGLQQSHALFGLSRSDALARLEAGASVGEGERVMVYRL